MTKEKTLIFTFEEAVVLRYCLEVFNKTDFTGLASEEEIMDAKKTAKEIYEKLTKISHDFTFGQLCVMATAIDNIQDLVAQKTVFDIPKDKINAYLIKLPEIKSKIENLLGT